MKTEFDIIHHPILTEKSQFLQKQGKYIFVVSSSSNKSKIKNAIEKIFDVIVTSVNILRKPAKKKVFKGMLGERKGYKKAILSIKKGSKIVLDQQ